MSNKKKKPKREPAIKHLADHLQRLANEAGTRYTLLRTKALIAKSIFGNGASVQSLSEKLGWPESRLVDLLSTESDIDLGSLADIFTAMDKQLVTKAEQP